ncbi:MAG: hypothetical protein AAGJ85_04470, partial [Pseudomonadota bacterium]
TSFNKSVLPAWFGDDRVLILSRTATSNPDARQRWRAASADDWRRYDAAAGHDFVGIGENSGRKLIRFAFFRDPINRAVSKWYHHLNKDEPSEAMKRLLDHHNGNVVSYLAETDLAFDYLRAFLPLELHLAYQSAIQRSDGSADFITRYPELWRAMLDKAVTNMASLDYMLLTERFTDSLKLLGTRIGKPVPQIERHRVGSIPDSVRANIERLRPELEAAQSNAYALMQVVRAKFERQMEGLRVAA